MLEKKGGIFISYRRVDTEYIAGRIYDKLIELFGTDLVFFDVEKIQPGRNFIKCLKEVLNECETFVPLIGTDWLCQNKNGDVRLHDENDNVRMEIRTALERNIRIIPILLKGAQMPSAEKLPSDIKEISIKQAITIKPDPYFHDGTLILINAIKERHRFYLDLTKIEAVVKIFPECFFLQTPIGKILKANYYGNCKNGVPHGNGSCTFLCDDSWYHYEGEWKEGCFYGKGELKKDSGETYNGIFCNWAKEGDGVFTKILEGSPEGKYEGEWKSNRKHGKGVQYTPTGCKYVGQFKEGVRHGYGIEYGPEGEVWNSGTWKNGRIIKD
ncbi:TIR domain-containing protein [Candidatus Uabimicrobium sp. HlEnr_7]|uniref:TIR domain-containing protein n=1 Tax=Candidatus Uabimicrobium helgolandensis TaxID=3095367 RepID=UPI0035589025